MRNASHNSFLQKYCLQRIPQNGYGMLTLSLTRGNKEAQTEVSLIYDHSLNVCRPCLR